MPRRQSAFSGREGGTGGGDLFAALAYVGAGMAAVLVLVAAVGRDGPDASPEVVGPDPAPLIRAELEERSALAREWQEALRMLCENVELQAEGLAPSCATGALTIPDALFESATSAQLSEEGMRTVQFAISTLLEVLRGRDLVWQHIESIELRGHSDPRARRDPYVTNLVGSGQRPLAMMIYLSSEWALSDRDRADLQRLAVVSSSSFSRPPVACPEETRECYAFWRRVEVIPRVHGVELRQEMQTLVERVDSLLPTPETDPATAPVAPSATP